jgi:hypothetical protein
LEKDRENNALADAEVLEFVLQHQYDVMDKFGEWLPGTLIQVSTLVTPSYHHQDTIIKPS